MTLQPVTAPEDKGDTLFTFPALAPFKHTVAAP